MLLKNLKQVLGSNNLRNKPVLIPSILIAETNMVTLFKYTLYHQYIINSNISENYNKWSCKQCTYINNIIMPFCEICNKNIFD